MSNNQITRQSIINNIEVYRCLNPLYYSIFDGELDNTKSFEIFKNLNNNTLIALDEKINTIFEKEYDFSSSSSEEIQQVNVEKINKFKKIFVNNSDFFNNTEIKNDNIFNIFYGNQHFINNYLNENNTLFIYIGNFENDKSLAFPQISKSSQIKVINQAFDLKSKDQTIKLIDAVLKFVFILEVKILQKNLLNKALILIFKILKHILKLINQNLVNIKLKKLELLLILTVI